MQILINRCFFMLLALLSPQILWADVSMQELQRMLDESNRLAVEQNKASDDAHGVGVEGVMAPKRVLIDVRSSHSDGMHDMQTLIGMAEKRGIESLVFTEHDRFSIRFGIDPMPHILGYSQEHPSLYTTGLESFFDDLQASRVKHPEISLFAGTESVPGYAWSGIPLQNLALHDAERHLIALGIERPAQVEGLSSYDLRHGYGNKALSLAFWCALVFVLIIILLRKHKRGIALLLMASFIVFLTTWLMKPKTDPDVDFVDTAHTQGLFVIWAHPGTLSGVRDGPMGVQLNTPPYSKRVFEEPTADAFAAIYGDTDDNTIAGGLWDRYLMDYLRGYHNKPIWAVAAGDFHEQGMAHEYLGNFPMDVWSDTGQADDVLAAMKLGHMAAWGLGKDVNYSLQALYLEDADGKRLLPGDETKVVAPLHAVVSIADKLGQEDKPVSLQGQWIIDGEVALQSSFKVGHGKAMRIALPVMQGAHVIRLQIDQGEARMVANPFLVHVQ